jgi:Ala-tRNA(Pro) deacylase
MSIATRIAGYLIDRHVPYDVMRHPHALTALSSAAASHVPAARLAKAVVVKGGEGDGVMLAVLPASGHIEFRKLRTLVGGDVKMAEEADFEPLFADCEPGAVPPLGGVYGLKVIVDDSLAKEPDIYFEGGDHDSLVHVSGTSFQKLMAHAQHGCFTRFHLAPRQGH